MDRMNSALVKNEARSGEISNTNQMMETEFVQKLKEIENRLILLTLAALPVLSCLCLFVGQVSGHGRLVQCRTRKSILHSAAAEERDVEKLKLEKDQMNQDILESERQAPHCKQSSASEMRLRLARSFFGSAKLRSRGRCTRDAVSSSRRVLGQPVMTKHSVTQLFAQSQSPLGQGPPPATHYSMTLCLETPNRLRQAALDPNVGQSDAAAMKKELFAVS